MISARERSFYFPFKDETDLIFEDNGISRFCPCQYQAIPSKPLDCWRLEMIPIRVGKIRKSCLLLSDLLPSRVFPFSGIRDYNIRSPLNQFVVILFAYGRGKLFSRRNLCGGLDFWSTGLSPSVSLPACVVDPASPPRPFAVICKYP